MEPRDPEPEFELNTSGVPTVPRPAAAVILLRGGEHGLELLLVRRNPASRFMGGAWVFPGGTVGRDEGSGQDALRAAAVRELREEAGIEVGVRGLVAFARWITPEVSKLRFDTWFYLSESPPDARPVVDGHEVVDHGWWEPARAVAAYGRGELALVFPTLKQLQQLSGFSSASALLAHARTQTVVAVMPLVTIEGETARIVLPSDADDAPD